MEREIKFRGLTSEGPQGWAFGFLYVDETGSYIKSGEKNKRFGTGIEVHPESVGQFTGLKDKNGKEIYSGDIVRILYTDWPSQTPDESGEYPLSLEDYKKSISAIGYVDWDNYSTGWIIRTKSKYSVEKDGTVMTSIIHGTHGEREIIGNIYENKDLL